MLYILPTTSTSTRNGMGGKREVVIVVLEKDWGTNLSFTRISRQSPIGHWCISERPGAYRSDLGRVHSEWKSERVKNQVAPRMYVHSTYTYVIHVGGTIGDLFLIEMTT